MQRTPPPDYNLDDSDVVVMIGTEELDHTLIDGNVVYRSIDVPLETAAFMNLAGILDNTTKYCVNDGGTKIIRYFIECPDYFKELLEQFDLTDPVEESPYFADKGGIPIQPGETNDPLAHRMQALQPDWASYDCKLFNWEGPQDPEYDATADAPYEDESYHNWVLDNPTFKQHIKKLLEE